MRLLECSQRLNRDTHKSMLSSLGFEVTRTLDFKAVSWLYQLGVPWHYQVPYYRCYNSSQILFPTYSVSDILHPFSPSNPWFRTQIGISVFSMMFLLLTWKHFCLTGILLETNISTFLTEKKYIKKLCNLVWCYIRV